MCAAVGGGRSRPAVYVISFYLPDLAEAVQKLLPEVKVIKMIPSRADHRRIDDEDLKTLQEEAEIIFCDTALTEACASSQFKKLRWVQTKGAGVNRLMEKIDLTNPPQFLLTRLTANCTIVGEFVMMHVLARERHFLDMHTAQQHKQWKQIEMAECRHIPSLTMCLIGVGAMGKEVARRCRQLGMKVHGVTRSGDTQCEDVHVVSCYGDLGSALSECDYICCCVPSTRDTTNLLSGDVLRVCQKRKPVLISVGRGDVIDEQTIVKAIREGWIRGAVLDVQPVEPLPESSPLWTLPNVFISPHVSGYNRNDKYLSTYASEFAENYRRFCRGEPLKNLVDFTKGY